MGSLILKENCNRDNSFTNIILLEVSSCTISSDLCLHFHKLIRKKQVDMSDVKDLAFMAVIMLKINV
jgi:hypothetical protein